MIRILTSVCLTLVLLSDITSAFAATPSPLEVRTLQRRLLRQSTTATVTVAPRTSTRTPRVRPTRRTTVNTLRDTRAAARRARAQTTAPVVPPALSLKQEVIRLTNAERIKAGLPVVTTNPLLEKSAQGHADDMKSRGYFSHDTPEGKTYMDRIKATGYGTVDFATCGCSSYGVSFGENNAKGQDTPAQVVLDWMNSPGHRDNILNADFTEIGIGIAGDIWVQNFGRVKLTR